MITSEIFTREKNIPIFYKKAVINQTKTKKNLSFQKKALVS